MSDILLRLLVFRNPHVGHLAWWELDYSWHCTLTWCHVCLLCFPHCYQWPPTDLCDQLECCWITHSDGMFNMWMLSWKRDHLILHQLSNHLITFVGLTRRNPWGYVTNPALSGCHSQMTSSGILAIFIPSPKSRVGCCDSCQTMIMPQVLVNNVNINSIIHCNGVSSFVASLEKMAANWDFGD